MFVDFDNGRILVHPAEPRAVQFAAADDRSGTGLLRAKAQAQAYAIDHPVTPDAGETLRATKIARFEKNHSSVAGVAAQRRARR